MRRQCATGLRSAAAGVVVLALCACSHDAVPPLVAQAQRDGRPMCGWDRVHESGYVRAPELVLAADGTVASAPLAAEVVAVTAPDAAPAAALVRAAAEIDGVLRLKLAFDELWLLPLTYPQPRPKPPPSEQHVAVVGHQTVTRDKSAERDRFGEVHVDGDRVVLYAESGAPAGEPLTIDGLTAALRTTEPPVTVFAITTTEATDVAQLKRVLLATACFDRAPGEEPHEVLLARRVE